MSWWDHSEFRGRIRDVFWVFLGWQYLTTNSFTCHRGVACKATQPRCSLQGGVGRQLGSAPSCLSDGLYQVERLRIARTWTDSNAKTRVCNIQASNNHKVKCVTQQDYGNTLPTLTWIWHFISETKCAQPAEDGTCHLANSEIRQTWTGLPCIPKRSSLKPTIQYGTTRLKIHHRSAGYFPARWSSGHVSENGRMFHTCLCCPHPEEGKQWGGLSSLLYPNTGEVNTPCLASKPLWHRVSVRDG